MIMLWRTSLRGGNCERQTCHIAPGDMIGTLEGGGRNATVADRSDPDLSPLSRILCREAMPRSSSGRDLPSASSFTILSTGLVSSTTASRSALKTLQPSQSYLSTFRTT